MSLLLKNCKLAGRDGLWNILIADGKIKEISQETVTVERVIDINGKYVLPGIIDPHVHFRDFEQSNKEDFLTGSRAAAAGGITTVLDMPNTQPVTDSIEMLKKRREAAKKSIVNYGFHFAATKGNSEILDKVKRIASVKLFMNISTGKLMIEDDAVLQRVFEKAKMLTVHAEGAQVERAMQLHSTTKNRLYLCHISAKSELEMIRKGGKRAYVEVTPHHLFLTEEDAKRLGSYGAMKPCLKTKEDQEALWKAIAKGRVDTIGSDHAPHTKEEKEGENPPSGVTGVETMLPLLLDAVNKGRLKIERVIELCCENPAKIFRIRGKGKIMEGYDADLVVVDMEMEKEIKNEELFTKCKWSPFNGWKLKGWPVMTIANGNIVLENGRVNDEIKGREVRYEIPFARKTINNGNNEKQETPEEPKGTKEIIEKLKRELEEMGVKVGEKKEDASEQKDMPEV